MTTTNASADTAGVSDEQATNAINAVTDIIAPVIAAAANAETLTDSRLEVLATMAEVDYQNLDRYGATMAYGAESMAYGELGQPDQAVTKALEADEALTLSEQGKFLRQPLTGFHTFALVAAGRVAEAVDVA